MDDTKSPTDFKVAIERIIHHTKEYIETRYQLIVFNIHDKSAVLFSSMTSVIVITVLALFILLFSSIGVSWYIGEVTGHKSVGFFCVAAFYFLILIIVYKFRETWIKIPVSNYLVKKLAADEKD